MVGKNIWIGGITMRTQLIFEDLNTKWDLDLKSNIVVVVGDSGNGKTYTYFKLVALSKMKDYNDIVTINKDTQQVELVIDNSTDKLIVIDNASLILNKQIKKKIREDSDNKYIIFGRDITDLVTMPYNIADLEVTIMQNSKNLITLKYRINAETNYIHQLI